MFIIILLLYQCKCSLPPHAIREVRPSCTCTVLCTPLRECNSSYLIKLMRFTNLCVPELSMNPLSVYLIYGDSVPLAYGILCLI